MHIYKFFKRFNAETIEQNKISVKKKNGNEQLCEMRIESKICAATNDVCATFFSFFQFYAKLEKIEIWYDSMKFIGIMRPMLQ